ncbi:hypothetical protein AN7855.2 [Aspergillus nidulans FGSC A4]|uniref:fatty-acyl-CoA synthase system n=1 Tax=Emericella nidulans (strain FGSC A4 / ATCC 38163 / CBS 112.46 / NRRL 194 / M139) TaxID=227321 RepID=Q5AV25_EMENI|nr:hypothetical protein [Aspergillus nidulans FGSC A4]EAA58900.1 hypothetical protein AN7855.2 [Aspergillus nidulans FGSC A4]CBF73392.1 TPA: fatty acid synthetase beta subunit, putative (JCVI) [Aspergillus nidulans FGSC A4]|eukprot:XP_681124.1 hypothetical protein AN7855.2 [Aspergillus nidulans FGSC A4]
MASLDVGIIVAWEALLRSLLSPGLGGDLSRLLHISNTFEPVPGMEPLRVGDLLKTTLRITAVTIKPLGKLVEVTVVIKREEASIMKITSEFLIQGQFPHHHQSFPSSEANEWALPLDSPKAVVLLRSRPWFKPDAKCPELLDKTLLFRITSQSSKMFTLNTSGFAGLSTTIVHGMNTSAVVRSMIEDHLAKTGCAKFCRWSTTFEDVVRGGDRLRIELQHQGMISGNMALEVQAPTAYPFCGQGSQKKEMGMAIYETDGSAKSAWHRGHRYLFELYDPALISPQGFSLLNIVRNNPKSLTVYFGTTKGRQIRANYLALARTEVINGREITVPVVDGLSESSSSITFEEPNGLLFSTQFAQLAISLMNIAESSALKARGLFQQGAAFAGHSLGEYSALLACADFMSLENLLSVLPFGFFIFFHSTPTAPSRLIDAALLRHQVSKRRCPSMDDTLWTDARDFELKKTYAKPVEKLVAHPLRSGRVQVEEQTEPRAYRHDDRTGYKEGEAHAMGKDDKEGDVAAIRPGASCTTPRKREEEADNGRNEDDGADGIKAPEYLPPGLLALPLWLQPEKQQTDGRYAAQQ